MRPFRMLEEGKPVVWATVVSQEGSAPRGSGSRMLISEGETTLGSVGGGKLEADVMKAAGHYLKEKGARASLLFPFREGGSRRRDDLRRKCQGLSRNDHRRCPAIPERTCLIIFSIGRGSLRHRNQGNICPDSGPVSMIAICSGQEERSFQED